MKKAACETPEEAQALFASERVKRSLDQIKAMEKFENEELSDDELDSVAGVCLSPEFFRRWGKRIEPTKPAFRFDDPLFDDPHDGRHYHIHW